MIRWQTEGKLYIVIKLCIDAGYKVIENLIFTGLVFIAKPNDYISK